MAQGIICMGPATRAGCKVDCISANIPCTGCMGALPKVRDQGAAMLSAIASLLDVEDEKEDEVIDSIKDIIGTFYKYSTAKLLPRGGMKDES